MFTKQVGQLGDMPGLPEESVTLLQDVFGNCQQALEHHGPVTITPTMPEGATQAALTVGNYQKDGGEGAYNIALELLGDLNVTGNIQVNGNSSPQLFPGAASVFVGTPTQLAIWLLNGWAIADGTLGTPDLSGRYLRASGGGFSVGDTGGSLTTGASSGTTGSATTGVTIGNHLATATSAHQVIVAIADSGHTHGITTVPIDVAITPAGGIAITAVNTPSASSPAGISSGTESFPGHTHNTPVLSHSVTDSGHTHSLGSHTHSIEPTYYVVTVLVFVG